MRTIICRSGLLSPPAIESQIALASHYLADWAGYAPYALSYPYGSRDACSPAAADVARRCGIRFAFTMERAANPDLSRPLHLARFDNNDLPGGKAARFAIDQAVRLRRQPQVVRGPVGMSAISHFIRTRSA